MSQFRWKEKSDDGKRMIAALHEDPEGTLWVGYHREVGDYGPCCAPTTDWVVWAKAVLATFPTKILCSASFGAIAYSTLASGHVSVGNPSWLSTCATQDEWRNAAEAILKRFAPEALPR